MPLITDEASDWVALTLKVTPELNKAIEDYADQQGEESMSGSLRTLIGLGLESATKQEGTVLAALRANVQASALARIDAVMTSAVNLIKSGDIFEDGE
jgi:hypothetical protein